MIKCEIYSFLFKFSLRLKLLNAWSFQLNWTDLNPVLLLHSELVTFELTKKIKKEKNKPFFNCQEFGGEI